MHCPAGTFAGPHQKECTYCARGFYQNRDRQGSCVRCPQGTYTREEGSKSVQDCVPVCGYGTYSPTGMVSKPTNCPIASRHNIFYSFLHRFLVWSVPETVTLENHQPEVLKTVKPVLQTLSLTNHRQQLKNCANLNVLQASTRPPVWHPAPSVLETFTKPSPDKFLVTSVLPI